MDSVIFYIDISGRIGENIFVHSNQFQLVLPGPLYDMGTYFKNNIKVIHSNNYRFPSHKIRIL